MPRKDSTALNNELALDESLTPFPMILCHSEPFHNGSGENCVCGGPGVKFPGFVVSSHSFPPSEPQWTASAQRQCSLHLKMCVAFSSCS
jgi:hypothetical protein